MTEKKASLNANSHSQLDKESHSCTMSGMEHTLYLNDRGIGMSGCMIVEQT